VDAAATLEAVRADLGKARSALDGTYAAANQVIAYFRDGAPKRNLLKTTALRIIRGNFDGDVKRVIRVQALEQLHVMEIWLRVDTRADRTDYLSDIQFSAWTTDAGRRISMPYVQCENGSHHKKVMLFFVPFLTPGQVREITLEYQWPRMYAALSGDGRSPAIGPLPRREELFEMDLEHETRDPIPEVEWDFQIDPALGETELELLGVHPPDASFVYDEKGAWPVWRYRARDVPPTKLRMNIRRVDGKKKKKGGG
jgi:hypothetical protein